MTMYIKNYFTNNRNSFSKYIIVIKNSKTTSKIKFNKQNYKYSEISKFYLIILFTHFNNAFLCIEK